MIPYFDWKLYPVIMQSLFDFEGYDFLFFDEPVPYYHLYRTERKLNSLWEVKYVGEVLLYLNPDMNYLTFKEMLLTLTDRGNGHIIRTYSKIKVVNMCEELYNQFDSESLPYVRRKRKIVFNYSRSISKDEKMSIVGQVIGRGNITQEKLYCAVESLIEKGGKITIVNIAKELKCCRQTIYRHLSRALREVIDYHNSNL